MSGVTDPIADMLTRVRNAITARHDSVTMPSSTLKVAVARSLKESGFIRDFEMVRGQPHRVLRIRLAYSGRREPIIKGLKRVSTPGRRVYVGRDEIPRVYGDLGASILTTSQGVMTGREARQRGLGGEVICYIW